MFKPRQMVTVAKDITDFPMAVASKPSIGTNGMIVLGNRFRKFDVPPGKVAVRFKATDLGYDYRPDDPFVVCYIDPKFLTKKKP